MPGMQLIQSWKHKPDLSKNILKTIRFQDNCQQKILFDEDNYLLYYSAWPGYPLQKYSNHQYTAFLEGYIYNDNPQNLISSLFSALKAGNSNIIKNLMGDLDADCLIYIIDKITSQLFIINDSLGRLPLYYLLKNDIFICSRDYLFLKNFSSRKICQEALIDYLLFMVPAHNDTLYQDIKKLPPAAILSSSKDQFSIKPYLVRNYQQHDHSNHKFDMVHKNCTELLLEGMQNRFKSISGQQVNVLLSGGLDSRTICAMLQKFKINAQTHTFVYPDKVNLLDYERAREISDLAGFKWQGFEVEELNYSNIAEIIALKGGMNYAPMANMLSFIKSITAPGEQYYTGDWGRILKNDFPREVIYSQNGLIEYLSAHKVIFSPQKTAQLLGISQDQVLHRIHNIFAAYPEKSFKYKYLHFLYQERTANWLQEGEDRNRYFFWSATPFSNQKLYSYAAAINPVHKKSFRLYLQIIKNINPRFLDIQYGILDQLTSPRYYIKDKLKLTLGYLPSLKRRLKPHKNIKKDFSFFDPRYNIYVNDHNRNLLSGIDHEKFSQEEFFTIISLLEFFK